MAEYTTHGAGQEFADAAKSGDRRRTLEALRDHIADRISDGIAARDLAALSRQLRDITKELEALGAANSDGTADDELAQRRAAVLSAAGVEQPAPRADAGAASRRTSR